MKKRDDRHLKGDHPPLNSQIRRAIALTKNQLWIYGHKNTMLEIRLAKTPKEKEQVFKLRYQIYVEELGYTQHYANHEQKRIEEPLDKSGHIFVALKNCNLVGTARSNYARK